MYLAARYILEAYMIKYKGKKRLSEKLSLSYNYQLRYRFLSHILSQVKTYKVVYTVVQLFDLLHI